MALARDLDETFTLSPKEVNQAFCRGKVADFAFKSKKVSPTDAGSMGGNMAISRRSSRSLPLGYSAYCVLQTKPDAEDVNDHERNAGLKQKCDRAWKNYDINLPQRHEHSSE